MISRLRNAISQQLSRPSGRPGRVIAAMMNRGNRGLNERAIARLDVHRASRVLDLGFGGGLTFAPLLEAGATIIGVDRAQDMIEAATRRHRTDVDAGRLTLHVGEAERLPLPDGAVDRVLTVNTVYFWPDLERAVREIHRVLAPGGRLVIAIRDGSVMQHVDPEVFTLRSPDDLVAALRAAGFDLAEAHSATDGATHLVVGAR